MEALKQKGVTIIAVDREPFRERVSPQSDAFIRAHPEAKPIIDIIRATRV
jgi:TRAP-type C4-dicarboxylate transport system substrate-binding protein